MYLRQSNAVYNVVKLIVHIILMHTPMQIGLFKVNLRQVADHRLYSFLTSLQTVNHVYFVSPASSHTSAKMHDKWQLLPDLHRSKILWNKLHLLKLKLDNNFSFVPRVLTDSETRTSLRRININTMEFFTTENVLYPNTICFSLGPISRQIYKVRFERIDLQSIQELWRLTPL